MINSIYDLNKENDGTSIQVHIICNLIEKLAKECKREELRKFAERFCGGNILQQSLKTNKKMKQKMKTNLMQKLVNIYSLNMGLKRIDVICYMDYNGNIP